MPLVSVCVPVYNGGDLLERSLKSILAQTFTNYELLVVDDGSTDGSYERAQSIVGSAPRARLIRNTHNLGLVGNWNRCVELARGEFVKFVFQDDWINPTCLERLVEAHRPGVGLVICKRRLEYAPETSRDRREQYERYIQKNAFELHFPNCSLISSKTFSDLVLKRPVDNCIGEPTTVLITKDVFGQLGLFNPNLIQLCDWEMWVRIGTRFDVAYVPEELAAFRVHRGGQSARNFAMRAYQTSMLDPLVLLHQILYSPVYKPFRTFATGQPLKMVALKRRFSDVAYEAAWKANRGIPRENGAVAKRRQAWLNITREHPEVRNIRMNYFLHRILYWALNRFFGLRVLWVRMKHANGQRNHPHS